eukprot:192505_1
MYMAMPEAKEEKDWKAEFIYTMNIEIIKGVELQTNDCEVYVKTECGNRQFITKNQNSSNPEWNEKTQFQFYRPPQSVVLSLIESANDSLIGQCTIGLTDFFSPHHYGLTELIDIQKGKLDVRVIGNKLDPFKTMKQEELLEHNKQEIDKYNAQIEEYNAQQDTYNAMDAEKARMVEECAQKQRELDTYTDAGKEYDMQIGKVEAECGKFAEERKKDPVQRMHDYALNVTKDEAEDDEDIQAKEDMDVAMIEAVLRDYKAADKAAKVNAVQKAEYDQKGQAEEAEEEAAQGKANKEKADLILIQMGKWKTLCDDLVSKDAELCLERWSYQDDMHDQRRWFMLYYVALAKLFLNLQIVGATLDVFKNAVKSHTKRGTTKCTLDDLREKREGKRESVWEILYEEKLAFVMKELNEVYPMPPVREKGIKLLCDKSSRFILKRYNGYFARFCRLISHWIVQNLMNEVTTTFPKSQDDAIVGMICLLFDKDEFCLKLHQLMQKHSTKQGDEAFDIDKVEAETKQEAENEDNGDGYAQEDDAASDEDADGLYGLYDEFEKVVSRIVIAIGNLWDALAMDFVDGEAQEAIDTELTAVLGLCQKLKIDEKSQKHIQHFFSYFFKPDKGGVLCCLGGDGEGASWIGKMFGSICRT